MNDEEQTSERLKGENEALRRELLEYKTLKEDLMAKRVMEKVTASFTLWVKVCGLTVSIVTAIGIGAIVEYVIRFSEKEIRTQVHAVVPPLVTTLTPQEISRQVVAQVSSPATMAQIKRQVQASLASITPHAANENAKPATSNGLAAVDTNGLNIDYTERMGPVGDQGTEGSCVGFACAAALEYQIWAGTGQKLSISPRYIYNLTRKKEGTLSNDAGALIHDAIELLQTSGAVEESVWPYKPGEFASEPPAAVAKAAKYYIGNPQKLTSAQEVAAALGGGPVVAGITLYESIVQAAKTGYVVLPKTNDPILGGTAVCIVGYDNQKRLFKFRNSWGPNWGDHGYGYLSYEYLDRYMSNDSWAFKYKSGR